jgi:hypothetical protein
MTRTTRASSIIWKTVVSAGAMLAGACAAKATTTTTPVAAETPAPEPAPAPTPAPAPPPPPVVAVAEVQPAPPPAPEPPPPPATVTVRVTSKPAGAEVLIDGEVRGKTPLEVTLPMAEGEVKLEVRRAGYATKEVVFKPAADQALEVVLVKNKKRARGVGTFGTLGHGSGTGEGRSQGRGFILS